MDEEGYGFKNRGKIRVVMSRWRGIKASVNRKHTFFLPCNLDVRALFESKTIVGDEKRKSPVIRCLTGDCGLRDASSCPLRCPRRVGSLVCI